MSKVLAKGSLVIEKTGRIAFQGLPTDGSATLVKFSGTYCPWSQMKVTAHNAEITSVETPLCKINGKHSFQGSMAPGGILITLDNDLALYAIITAPALPPILIDGEGEGDFDPDSECPMK